MVNGEFKRGTQTKVNAEPIEDGSILLSTDEKQLYIDAGTDRLPIEGANAVTIRNKGNITATKAELENVPTFQEKLTQYIVTNEGRQPKSFDGLIITFSDLHKGKTTNVLYVFNATRGSWNDVGDATYTYPIDQALTAVGTDGTSAAATYGVNDIKGNVLNSIIAGAQNIVDATGTSDENGGTAQQDIVTGWQNRVTANNSLVTGARNIAKGHNTTLNGQDNEGRQYNGYAMGNKNVITGENAQAFGEALIAGSEQTVVGKQNIPVDDAVFVVGYGRDNVYPYGRSTAMYISRNGEMLFPNNNYSSSWKPAPVKRVVSQNYKNITSINGNGSGKILDDTQAIVSGEKSVALNVNQEAQRNIATTVLKDDNGSDLTVEKSGKVFNLVFWAKCAVDKDITFTVGDTDNPTTLWGSDRTYDVGTKTVTLKANEWRVVSIPVGTGTTKFTDTSHFVTLGATFAGAVENPQTVYVTRVIVDKAVNWLSNSATSMLCYDEWGETTIFSQDNYGSAKATNHGTITINPANNTGALRPQFWIAEQNKLYNEGLKVTSGKTYHVTMTIAGLSTDNLARFWITNNSDTTTNFPYTLGAQKDALKVLEPSDMGNGTYDFSFKAARNGYLRIGFSSYPKLEIYTVNNLSIYEDGNTIPPVYIWNNSDNLDEVIPVRYKIDEIQYFDSQVNFLKQTNLSTSNDKIYNQGALLPNAGKSAGYVLSVNSQPVAEADALSEISANMDATERGIYIGLSFNTSEQATYDCFDLAFSKNELLSNGLKISNEQIVIEFGDTDRAIINKANWNKKLDKLTANKQVYTTNANGTTMGIPWATEATANTIPYRDAYGRIEVGTPSGANNAVPKSYVDNQTKTTMQIVEGNRGAVQYNADINPIDMQMADWGGHNVAAFCDPAGIAVEYSNDGGTTWINYGLNDLERTAFVSLSMRETSNSFDINLGKKFNAAEQTTQDCLRITIDSTLSKIGSAFISCLLIYAVLNHSKMSISYQNADGVISNLVTDATFANSGTICIPLKLFLEQQYKLILTFQITSTSTQLQKIQRLALCSGVRSKTEGNSNLAKTGRIYALNAKQEALFPATVQTPTLRIGNTEVNEEQLKKLLALINTTSDEENTDDETI